MTLFRVHRRRPLRKTLRKVFVSLVSRVEKELAVTPLTPPSVHEARKSVKRLRALVSLVSDHLKSKAHVFDRTLRDVNRVLSATRDATVAIATLEHLARDHGNGLSNDFAAAQAALDRRLAQTREHDFHVERDVVTPLKRLQQRWQKHTWPSHEWRLLEPNLRRTYRNGRRMVREVADGAPAERLHDLRKLVKHTQYHAEFLKRTGTPRLPAEHDEWERLADLLGQHHDLWVLRELLRTMSTKDLPRISRTLVLAEVGHAARNLELQVSELAPILYAERPRAFTDRWHAYWKQWRRHGHGSRP